MKITKSQLRGMIKEEISYFLSEHQPPSEEDIADAYGQSMTGGSVRIDGEDIEVDRLDEPETEAMWHVLDQMADPKVMSELLKEMFEHPGIKKHLESWGLNRAAHLTAKDIQPVTLELLSALVAQMNDLGIRDAIEKGNPSWDNFKSLVRRVTDRIKVGRIADVGRERMQQEKTAKFALSTALGELINRAGLAGKTDKGAFGVGKQLGFKNIEPWEETSDPFPEPMDERKKRTKRKRK